MGEDVIGKYATKAEAWAVVCEAEGGERTMMQNFDGRWIVLDAKAYAAKIKAS